MNSLSSHTSTQTLNTGGRIEYIDAMRGFTMILVVLNHVALFCLGITRSVPSYHIYLQEIQMPLFFFISGFVLYKSNVQWDIKQTAKFITSKIPILIITPFIFLFIYLYINNIPFHEGLFNKMKYGYWFTFVLFVFFIYYALIRFLLNIFKINTIYSDISIFLLGFSFYFLRFIPINEDIKGLFCMNNWYQFIFLAIGTLLKKHLQSFQAILDHHPLLIILIAVFFLLNIFNKETGLHSSLILLFITALAGVILVFSLFRRYQALFSKKSISGKCLQIIGQRTLDIYLIHFFLLPVFLKDLISSSLTSHPIPILELTLSLLIALIIIAGCLLISNILRLSPFLAHWLFGAKYPKNA